MSSFTGIYRRAQIANPSAQPCRDCGAPGKERHHDDYSKPEEIVWLCVKCHRGLHYRGKNPRLGEYRARPETAPIIEGRFVEPEGKQ